ALPRAVACRTARRLDRVLRAPASGGMERLRRAGGTRAALRAGRSPLHAPRARSRRRAQRDVRNGTEEPVAAASRRVGDDTQARARDAVVQRRTDAARTALAAPAGPGPGPDRPGGGR